MSNTFISKVLAERQVLEIVNRKYSRGLQLSGLSYSAIEYWRGRVSLAENHPLIECLAALGTLTQTLSNRSNESFSPLSSGAEPEIRRLIGELSSQVAAARGEG